ncbi:hypothetical protein NW762_000702 [Fusarium torreyae]|uniref:Uncharacterized protein n=1 Tax=Fusarium torreyae TaxID=1237075 RepID=A0A9W8SGW5_9HYPO|nr:hypothetical protein NW762_000702 [Fusarium torreyae]
MSLTGNVTPAPPDLDPEQLLTDNKHRRAPRPTDQVVMKEDDLTKMEKYWHIKKGQPLDWHSYHK